jgi:hypothetical protein
MNSTELTLDSSAIPKPVKLTGRGGGFSVAGTLSAYLTSADTVDFFYKNDY